MRGSRSNRDIYRRIRRDRSDLIDLSNEITDSSSNNILNLFDPLNHTDGDKIVSDTKNQHLIQRNQDKVIKLKNPRSRSIDRSQEPRNETLKNARPCPTSNQSVVSRSSTSSVSSSELSAKINSSADDEVNICKINKLSVKDGNDRSSLCRTSNRDLCNSLQDDRLGNDSKLKLTRKHQRSSAELVLLTKNIKSFRARFKHHDIDTNSGIIYSPTLYGFKNQDMSVKIIISSPLASEPLNFTCNISTTVEHLISHAVCSIFDNLSAEENMDKFMLKVTGKDEYFNPELKLADYALISHCCKFDLDVQLSLIRLSSVKRSLQRTSKDDFHFKSLLCPDDLLSRVAVLKFSDLNYEALSITIDTFDREAKRLYNDVTNKSTSVQTQSLLQCTKAICSLMMSCETGQLSESKDNLAELCKSYRDGGSQLEDDDRYKMIEVIQHAIMRLVRNMHRLLKLTSSCLPVDYEVEPIRGDVSHKNAFVNTSINLVRDSISMRIHLISQLKPEWLSRYQKFHLELSVKHGESYLGSTVSTSKVKPETSFFPRLLLNHDIIIPVSYSALPREARIVVTLVGTELPVNHLPTSEDYDEPGQLNRTGSSTSIRSTAPMYSSSPGSSQLNNYQKPVGEAITRNLARSIAYFFDHNLNLRQGDRLMYMHPSSDDETEDIYIETVIERENPIILIEFRNFPPEKRIYFPEVNQDLGEKSTNDLKFDMLDPGIKYVLKSIIYDKQRHEGLMDDEKELLWNNRLYLKSIPEALPKVLISAPDWSFPNLEHIYDLANTWTPLGAVDAIQLMLPTFPDVHIRQMAVNWISRQHDDELYDYLPQLLQAFKYEKTIDCPLFWLLFERALKNIRIANLMYWQLKLISRDSLLQERGEILIQCLLWMCGSAFWKSIDKQENLLNQLTRVSNEIKKTRDGQRMNILHKKLELVQDYLIEEKPSMPWSASLEICDLNLKECSYFPSNTLPLKLAFRSCEESCNKVIKFHSYDTIFKIGDDLRQDMLAMQMIRIMEKLWLREGLDLRIVTYDCLATNDRQGMVEVVKNAETLRKIHQSSGFLTGAFNPKAIDSYIRHWNETELEYRTALDKFLHSCAGYTIATYILGICDRHNDNIMITNSGHLFHIDFGKFLGDAQMMGSIKRDRTPFVLTADMAYVINGGDKPSKKFQTFIELCAMGFNIIRRNRNLFLNLFSLMSSANINGLNKESVDYIDRMLMPNLTETEAMAKFARLIEECLNSRSTQVNFFIHNLAQLRFSSDNTKQSLLSFVPKTFTIHTDGKIEALNLVHLYKKYEPEKQYYYVVRVKRENQPDTTDIARTFREFSELQMKLNCMFPSNSFHNINRSTGSFLMDFVGRNNTREIAERRISELEAFLLELLRSPPEVSQCDLIYTFFHPILRDQETNPADLTLSSEASTSFGPQEYTEQQRSALYLGSNGQVKVSLSYKNTSFIIMIMHAKNLTCPEGSLGPNCYAKTYLLPDPQKQTKRKTRTVRQSCHPSFMELIVYKIPLSTLKRQTLQVSIWHSELVQNKAFMGAALIPLDKIDLSKETTSWYPLKDF